jgi:hypothetical protein
MDEMSVDKSLLIPKSVRVQHTNGYVEEMSLNEYIKGVVPTYLGLQAPREALKALAIAVRSDASISRRHARDAFDLCATGHCPIWKPANRYPDSDRAIDETTGLVLTVNGPIVAAPFFEHCDGHTRSGDEGGFAAMSHCRSVPCQCGYSLLHGHGVGMCQRGAIAMARQGASATEILKHYYAQVEVSLATETSRADLVQSLIVGRVLDSNGRPCPDLRLALTGPGGTFHKATAADGRFWFANLPGGEWQLQVKGKPVRQGGLRTDGRNTLDVQMSMPGSPRLAIEVIPMAGPRQLAGTLGYDGVPVSIVDAADQEQTVLSGSAPDFDPGGFAFPLPLPGKCVLRVFDQSFDLEIGESGALVRFSSLAE